MIAFPGVRTELEPEAPRQRAATGRAFQLIWRRVLVDGSSTLGHVHEVIQAAFGWWGYHLHEFEVGRARSVC